MKITAHRVITEFTTVFSYEEIANLLYLSLPTQQQLPGSPLLRVTHINDGLRLTQTLDSNMELK